MSNKAVKTKIYVYMTQSFRQNNERMLPDVARNYIGVFYKAYCQKASGCPGRTPRLQLTG